MIATGGWPAPAKLNLFLHVVGRRDDGYHLLQTLFQFLDHGDVLRFTPRADGIIRRTSQLAGVAAEDDLVVRAARLLKATTGCEQGADIAVEKVLPQGSGLGGGSSDAATTLVALNAIWDCALSTERLADLGLRLGADVPVFVRGETAWAEGVGERLTPCPQDEGVVLVVTPPVSVATARVFSDAQLTRNTAPITMPAFSLSGTKNDCEPVTRRLYPEVALVLDWLAQFAPARMSGTGASVFALFEDFDVARDVARRVPPNWRWFCAFRRNRSPLLDFLARAGARGGAQG